MKNLVVKQAKVKIALGCLIIGILSIVGHTHLQANDYREVLEQADNVNDIIPFTSDGVPTDSDYEMGFDPSLFPDDGSQIDVMILYSPIVELMAAADSRNMAREAERAILEANLINKNSGVEFEFNLVHVQSITNIDTYNHDNDLQAVSVSDEVKTLRMRHQADLVSYWNPILDGCGKAYTPEKHAFHAQSAFSVVSYHCLFAPVYGFAQMIGHNFGLMHESGSGTDIESPATSYGRGYAVQSEFRTISTIDECQYKCPRIPYWSNPDITYLSTPTGIEGQANSVKALNENAYTIANYAQSKRKCHVEYASTTNAERTFIQWKMTNTGEAPIRPTVFWILDGVSVSEIQVKPSDETPWRPDNVYFDDELVMLTLAEIPLVDLEAGQSTDRWDIEIIHDPSAVVNVEQLHVDWVACSVEELPVFIEE